MEQPKKETDLQKFLLKAGLSLGIAILAAVFMMAALFGRVDPVTVYWAGFWTLLLTFLTILSIEHPDSIPEVRSGDGLF